MSAKQSVDVINRTRHSLSPGDLREVKAKAPAGATRMEVVETRHVDLKDHALELFYTTIKARFLYCKSAGGDFSVVLSALKACHRVAKIGSRQKAPVDLMNSF